MHKSIIAGVFAAISLTAAPVTGAADPASRPLRGDPNDPCFLSAGCFWAVDGWVCPNPDVYMMCAAG